MSKRIIIKGKAPKVRRPVANKPNTTMKSIKDYNRKGKNGKTWRKNISEE
jgi:hypothetical protein